MANPYTVLVKPICIGNQVVETVKTYKLLRVTIKEGLKCNLHVDRGEWRGGGGEVSPRKSVVQSACQYDVTSRVSNSQNGEQSVRRRDG